MPYIPYRATNFQSTPPGLGGILSTSWAKYLWSAATVGRKNWKDLIQKREFSALELTTKALRIQTYLRTRGDFIVKSSNYDRLDPTEKGHIEYEVGQTDAKLVADKLFGTPWLMHLSLYEREIDVTYSGKARPDLLGLTRSLDWVVLEAKGTGGKLKKDILDYAKKQTQAISTINGCPPKLRVVAGSQFEKSGTLEMVLKDPDDHLEGAPRVIIDLNVFLLSYYRPLLTLIETGNLAVFETRYANRSFQVIDLPRADLRIGLDIHLRALLRQTRNLASDVVDYLGSAATTEITQIEVGGIPIEIGGDGIVVIPGTEWRDEFRSIDQFDKKE
jgi:hypothetical protein